MRNVLSLCEGLNLRMKREWGLREDLILLLIWGVEFENHIGIVFVWWVETKTRMELWLFEELEMRIKIWWFCLKVWNWEWFWDGVWLKCWNKTCVRLWLSQGLRLRRSLVCCSVLGVERVNEDVMVSVWGVVSENEDVIVFCEVLKHRMRIGWCFCKGLNLRIYADCVRMTDWNWERGCDGV